MVKRPTFVDLFSGAGLFSQGFVDAGFEPVLAVDLDPAAIASYCANVAPVAITRPVHRSMDLPTADVLIAGPPCQGFSTLGTRDPADQRNSLSLEIPALAAKAAAKIVVIENVPPYLSSPHWSTMTRKLMKMGYSITTWVLAAEDYGTPQRRRRAFTIATSQGLEVAAPIKDARAVSAHVAFRRIRPGDPMHTFPAPSSIALERFSVTPPNGDKRDVLRTRPDLCPPSWFRMGVEATDVWGRIDTEVPANTLKCRFQNPSTGRYVHPTEHRVISLREGARLQGVPDSWIFVGGREAIVRQIGNGVPIPLARAVARTVFASLAGNTAEAMAA